MAVRFTRLTRPSTRQLRPGQKITEQGITVECLKDGDFRYSVNIMVDGQRIHRVVGRQSEGVTRTQAEEFIAEARAKAREGRLSLPAGRKIKLTFGRAADLYLQKLRESGGKGMADKERNLRLHLRPFLGQMPLDMISSFTLEKYRKKCRARGMATGSINRTLATYRHMANKLFEWREIKTPMAMIKLEAENNRRDYVLTSDEKAALLEAALQDSNPRIWLFIMMGLHTGLRHSEILSARFEGLDVARRRLRVRVKGGRRREQPLTRAMTDILNRERSMVEDQDGWIFPSSRSKGGHVYRMKAAFRRTARRAGLDPKRVTPHTMRHTAITEMAESGAEARTIQAFSGHKSPEMVWRYTHARDQRIDEAMDRFESEGTKVERLPDRREPRS